DRVTVIVSPTGATVVWQNINRNPEERAGVATPVRAASYRFSSGTWTRAETIGPTNQPLGDYAGLADHSGNVLVLWPTSSRGHPREKATMPTESDGRWHTLPSLPSYSIFGPTLSPTNVFVVSWVDTPPRHSVTNFKSYRHISAISARTRMWAELP